MNSDTGNYAQHARFWDWSGHDRTEEDEYWLEVLTLLEMLK